MTSAPPKILLFDVMSTLVYDPIHHEIPAFFDLSLADLYATKHPTAWTAFERGELSEQRFYEIYFPDRPDPIDGEALRTVLYRAYRWLDGMEAILDELQAPHRTLYALSNYPVWYEIIEEKLQLSRYLQWSFVSCRTGIRKPDAHAYRNVLSTLDRAPEECLFIDDRDTNCEAARQQGLHAIVFDNAAQLRRELATFKLVAP